MKIKKILFGIFMFILCFNYVDASSEQQALWFMNDLNISQVPGGDYSHLGTLNFDVTGVNSNDIFAPFDCTIVAIYDTWNSGNTVVIESKNPVRYANGTVDYMTMTFAHDNDISNLYVGKELRQGEVFYQTGTYGNVTGRHSHVSCIKGKFQWDIWTENSYGNSWSPNSIHPTDALYIKSSTSVYDTKGLSFKKSDVDEEAPVVNTAHVDISSMTSNSYKVLAKASDNVGVTQVKVPTWTLKEDANGEPQDDLVWHDATYNSNTGYWECTIKASDHNNEIDIYRTHIYAYDAKGNRSTSYKMQFIPMGSSLNHSFGDEFLARISAYGLDHNNSLVVGLESTTGSSIQLKSKFTNFNDEYQIFKFKKNSDNTYTITNLKTGLYLDPKGAENNGGRQFQVTAPNGQTNQKYYLTNYNGGIRLLVASSSNEFKGMDLQGAQLVENASFIPYEPRTINKANHTFSFLKVATDITFDETDVNLNVRETKQINVSFVPSDTYFKELNYVSSDSNVVTVDSNGLITAKAPGNATITVTTKDGGNVSKSINVTVTANVGFTIIDGQAYYFDSNSQVKTGLIYDNDTDKYYYANKEGILQKGLQTISNQKYYFSDEYSMVKGEFITIDNKLYYFGAKTGTLQKTGWYEKNGKKYYLDKTTGEVYRGLKVIDNVSYYFDSFGVMQKGQVVIDNKTYYFDSNGKMVKGEFITIDNKLYYFGAASGTLQKTGWYDKNGYKYYLDTETGEVYTGFKTIANKIYYFKQDGKLQKSGLTTIENKTYYFNPSNGVAAVGKLNLNNNVYYFNNNAEMVKGEFITIDNKLYYFGAKTGTLQKTGWYEKNGKKYYLDKTTGEVYRGLKVLENVSYYFDSFGVMQKGLVTINNNQYYFDKFGKMVKGEFITINNKLYYFGAKSGSLQKTGWYEKNDKTYFLDKTTGEVAIGLVVIDSQSYYFNSNGELVKGEFITVNNKLYYFGAKSGSLQKTGWYEKNGKKYYLDKTTGEVYRGLKTINDISYYFDSFGVMQKGLVTINNSQYYFDKNGKMVKGEFITINNKLYYFGAKSGSLQKTGWYEKNGKKYYLDKTTGEVYRGLKTIDDISYYFDSFGVMQKGLVSINNQSYYFNNNGEMIKGEFIALNNKLYYFGAKSGSLQKTGWYEKNGKKYYLDKTTGEVAVGRVTIDNVLYEFNQDGVWNSGWKTIDGKKYYLYLDGTKATDWVTIAGIKCYFNPSGELIQKNALKVIDVSHHNGNIDWNAVKNTDVDGAIVRLGYGTSYTTDDPVVDRYWDANFNGTINNNLLFGIYLYSYAIDEVSANLEADFVIRYLEQRNFDKNRVIYYDLEENEWTKNLTKDDYDIIIRTFINRLEAKGYKVEVYTYKFWAENKLSDYGRSKLTWIAHYTDTCGYTGSYNGWQYTSDGSVNGINGVVDISVFKKF